MNYKIYLSLTVSFIFVYFIYSISLLEDISRSTYFGSAESTTTTTSRNEDSACPEKLVFQWNSGGQLGNQMMDYATVYVAARELPNHVGKTDSSRKYLEKYFDHIEMQDLTKECKKVKEKRPDWNTLGGTDFHEMTYNGSANASTIANFSASHDTVVFGYFDWLPNLYFKYVNELKYIFRFKDPIMNEALNTLEYVRRLHLDQEKPLLFIGVHVRRGDYENHLRSLYNISLLPVEYFIQGMEYFHSKFSSKYKVIYLAVTNDIQWVDINIKFNDFYHVSKYPAADMALLSLCNHTLTDYGTFGLWPSLFHGGEHYTTNVYEDFIVAMMYDMKDWTVKNITTPLITHNHKNGWASKRRSLMRPSTEPPLHLESTW